MSKNSSRETDRSSLVSFHLTTDFVQISGKDKLVKKMIDREEYNRITFYPSVVACSL